MDTSHDSECVPARRELLLQAGRWAALVACGLARPAQAASAAFEARTLDDVLQALGARPVESADISLVAPEIAENGAAVPLTITSHLPRTQEIFIVIDRNPGPLAAAFALAEGAEPFIATRVKMAGSARVHAVVRAGGVLYATSREVQVTLGGCAA